MTVPFIHSVIPSARHQIDLLIQENLDLAIDWMGFYLHGSLAMGCFNPATSDIDLIGVAREPLTLESRRDLASILLRQSKHPHPIEISYVTLEELRPWQYPPRYELHYSEAHRHQYQDDLIGDGWKNWRDPDQVDPDLAAHYSVLRRRGKCLWGKPVLDIFPEVPREDYLKSIQADFAWAAGLGELLAVYQVLNLCRALAYCRDGRIRSKAEGGEWGLKNLPERFSPGIQAALAQYRGGNEPPPSGFVEEFSAEFLPKIQA